MSNLNEAAIKEMQKELAFAEAWERYLHAQTSTARQYKVWVSETEYRYVMNGRDVTDFVMNDVEVPNARFFDIKVIKA